MIGAEIYMNTAIVLRVFHDCFWEGIIINNNLIILEKCKVQVYGVGGASCGLAWRYFRNLKCTLLIWGFPC